ncbi:hypothetical protein [Pseudacidovorax intermedius]|uniref:hypothetical protein n=1 Tax=Pseudacidovorax intermedius TaxID=433924 RepID=UPI0012DEECE4|nr:hypothetical protein [Pseudacidovorax intermedius]
MMKSLKKYELSILALFFFFYLFVGYVENIFNSPPALEELVYEEVEISYASSIIPNFKFYKNNEIYSASFPYDLGNRRARQYVLSEEEINELRGARITIGYSPIKSFLRRRELFIWSISKDGKQITFPKDIYSYYERGSFREAFCLKLFLAIGAILFCFYMDKKENR